MSQPSLNRFAFVPAFLIATLGCVLEGKGQSRTSRSSSTTSSHRRLPLPPDGTNDLSRQFRLLQHLQQLVDQRDQGQDEVTAGDSTSNAGQTPERVDPGMLDALSKSLDPQQREALQDLRERMGDLQGLGPDDAKRVNEGLSELLSDPQNAEETAKRLLEQYHRDRTLPRGGGQGAGPSLPGNPASGNPASRQATDELSNPGNESAPGSELDPGGGSNRSSDSNPSRASNPDGALGENRSIERRPGTNGNDLPPRRSQNPFPNQLNDGSTSGDTSGRSAPDSGSSQTGTNRPDQRPGTGGFSQRSELQNTASENSESSMRPQAGNDSSEPRRSAASPNVAASRNGVGEGLPSARSQGDLSQSDPTAGDLRAIPPARSQTGSQNQLGSRDQIGSRDSRESAEDSRNSQDEGFPGSNRRQSSDQSSGDRSSREPSNGAPPNGEQFSGEQSGLEHWLRSLGVDTGTSRPSSEASRAGGNNANPAGETNAIGDDASGGGNRGDSYGEGATQPRSADQTRPRPANPFQPGDMRQPGEVRQPSGARSASDGNSSSQAPGNQVPGNQVPGNQVPGNQVPGNQVPGNQAPGNQATGNQATGNQKMSPPNGTGSVAPGRGGISPNGSPRTAGDLSPVEEPPSLAELLRQANRDPSSLPPLQLPENSMGDLKELLSDRLDQQRRNRPRPDWMNEMREYIPDEVRAELQRTGVEKALGDIVENVRSEARSPSPSGAGSESNSASPGSPGTNARAPSNASNGTNARSNRSGTNPAGRPSTFESMRDQLAELAQKIEAENRGRESSSSSANASRAPSGQAPGRDGSLDPRSHTARNGAAQNGTPQSGPGATGSRSQQSQTQPNGTSRSGGTRNSGSRAQDGPGLVKQMSDFYKRVTRADDGRTSSSAAGSSVMPQPSSGGGTNGGVASAGGLSWGISLEFLLAVTAIILLLVIVWYQRTPLATMVAKPQASLRRIKINCREDVIRAFHLLVDSTNIAVEDWWPHRRAAGAVSEAIPSRQSEVRALAQLYELARYTPEQGELTEEQLRTARHAVETLTS